MCSKRGSISDKVRTGTILTGFCLPPEFSRTSWAMILSTFSRGSRFVKWRRRLAVNKPVHAFWNENRNSYDFLCSIRTKQSVHAASTVIKSRGCDVQSMSPCHSTHTLFPFVASYRDHRGRQKLCGLAQWRVHTTCCPIVWC